MRYWGIVFGLLFIGCSQQVFRLHPNSEKSYLAKEKDRSHFFIGGLEQTDTIDAARICGGHDKVAKVSTRHNAGDILLGILSLGIYSPREKKVYCLDSKSIDASIKSNWRFNKKKASSKTVSGEPNGL